MPPLVKKIYTDEGIRFIDKSGKVYIPTDTPSSSSPPTTEREKKSYVTRWYDGKLVKVPPSHPSARRKRSRTREEELEEQFDYECVKRELDVHRKGWPDRLLRINGRWVCVTMKGDNSGLLASQLLIKQLFDSLNISYIIYHGEEDFFDQLDGTSKQAID